MTSISTEEFVKNKGGVQQSPRPHVKLAPGGLLVTVLVTDGFVK